MNENAKYCQQRREKAKLIQGKYNRRNKLVQLSINQQKINTNVEQLKNLLLKYLICLCHFIQLIFTILC